MTSREAKRNKLQFTKLFYWLPLPLLAGYIGGLYVNFALYNGQLLPFSRNEFLMLISPYGFDFHPIGIVIGITIAVVSFMMTIPSRHEKKLWINVLSQAFCVSFIPFGLLLLMGDHFIGQPTTSIRGIETFRADISRWSELGSVYPIGAFVALLGTVGFFFQRRGHHSKTQGTGYLTLG